MFVTLAVQVSVDVNKFGAWFMDTNSVAIERVHRFSPFRSNQTK